MKAWIHAIVFMISIIIGCLTGTYVADILLK